MRRLWRMTMWPGLSGEGGLLSPGRWHASGRPVIYASEHPALAMLEVLANLHLRPEEMPLDYRMLALDLANGYVQSPAPELPEGWQANEPATRTIGTSWLDSLSALVLPVPSALLAHATNFIINPRHVQAATHLAESSNEPIWIDQRLLARAKRPERRSR